MHAGNLKHLVDIQHQVTTQDALGQVVGAWATLCSVWADIRLPSGLEQLRGDAFVSRTRASIRIRHRSDITAGMRVLIGLAVYDIEAVLSDTARREFVDLACKAVQ